MEALYQTWGRQMNCMAKMGHQSRPQHHENNKDIKANENLSNEKSLAKARK
jgi:hypothetical protein